MKRVGIVLPIFNERESIFSFFDSFIHFIKNSEFDKPYSFSFIFIEDGSSEPSLDLISKVSETKSSVLSSYNINLHYIALSRNFGKESALKAGLDFSFDLGLDCAIPLDIDLQDDIYIIPKMLKLWSDGNLVVNAKRSSRPDDSPLKSKSAKLFYKLIKSLGSSNIPENVGDFRVIDNSVLKMIKDLPESINFMKGVLNWHTNSSCYVTYIRRPRLSGYSKFNALKLIKLGLDGLVAFGDKLPFYIALTSGALSLASILIPSDSISNLLFKLAIIPVLCYTPLQLQYLITLAQKRPQYVVSYKENF